MIFIMSKFFNNTLAGVLILLPLIDSKRASLVVLVVKNLPTNAGDARDASLIPGSGRSLE